MMMMSTRNDWYRLHRALSVFESTGKPLSSFASPPVSEVKYDFRPFLLTAPRKVRLYTATDYSNGYTTPHQELFAEIDARCERILYDGLVEETIGLLARGMDENSHSGKGVGYRQAIEYLRDEWFALPSSSAAREIRAFLRLLTSYQTASRQLARRQMSWFRSEPEYVMLSVD